MSPDDNASFPPDRASLVRRLLAIIYDGFLLVALLFIASAAAVLFNQGDAIVPSSPAYPLYIACLVGVAFLFYGWFWTHGGQTLGMKTWKLRLVNAGGGTVSWKQGLIRFCVALVSWGCCGLGFLWSLFDVERRTWHDMAAGTLLLDLRKSR